MPNITGNILKKINNFFRKMKISILKLLDKLIELYKEYHKISIYFVVIAIVFVIIIGFIQSYYIPNISLKLTIAEFLAIIGLEMFVYNFYKAIYELWQENPFIVISSGIAYIFIVSIIVATKDTPEEITKNIIIYLTTIATLLFAFIPKGLIDINDRFRYKRIYQPYEPEKLSKKAMEISYFLSIFVGLTILDILITPVFQNFFLKNKIKGTLHYVYFVSHNKLLIFPTSIYLAILVYSIMALILGFLEIFLIFRYLFLYENNFKDLESFTEWTNSDRDWVIKNNLTKKFKNYKNKAKFEDYYEIWDFIYKFEEKEKELEAQNVKKKSKSKIFDCIMKDKD